MNILIITDILPVSGPTTYLENLLHTLSRTAHRTTAVLFTENVSQIPQNLVVTKNIIIAPVLISNFYSLRSLPGRFFRIASTLHSIPTPDLVITDLMLPMATILLLRLSKRLKHVPILYQFHGIKALEDRSRKTFFAKKDLFFIGKLLFERAVISQAHTVLAFSAFAKKQIIDVLHIPSKKVILVKPGIDWRLKSIKNISQEDARKKLGFSQEKKIILIVSRIDPRKGIHTLLNQFSKDTKGVPQFAIILVSDFSHAVYDIFSHFPNKLNAHIRLIHNPDRQSLGYLYKAADVTIMPSTELETFGFTTFESLYLGTTAIGFSIGANPELIKPPWLIPTGKDQYDAMCRKVQQYILRSNKHHQQISKSVLSYTWETYLKTILAYKKVSTA